MKIIFAGTPEFAAVALRALHAAGHEITLVLTQPDRPAGRGMQLHPSVVKQFALQYALPIAQPISLRLDGKYPNVAQQAHMLLNATEHDVMIVAAYGLILPPSILAIPRLGCLNIHASMLPRWRGAAPIHRAIEAGDIETGITIMQMDQGLDTGPMLLAEALTIADQDTTGSLHDRLAELGGRMIVEALQRLDSGALAAHAQPETDITYAAKIRKDEALLDFAEPATLLARRIRAFNPAPGAVAIINDTAIKLWHAEVVSRDSAARSGEILAANATSGLIIACGTDALRLTELQKPGGKRLRAAEFLQGFPLSVGTLTVP
jgi:methionyl-tRNA formyltransferase